MNFSYDIIRTKRKTVGLQVKEDCSVIVRVPLNYSDEIVEIIVEKHSSWIVKAIEKQRFLNENKTVYTNEDIAALKTKAAKIIFERVEYYSKIMKLEPTSVKITSAKRRFGSCSGKNGLCFSLYLADYPIEAIDYVVVHELAHIKHHNHSARFYALVEKYLPDYKRRAELLKK